MINAKMHIAILQVTFLLATFMCILLTACNGPGQTTQQTYTYQPPGAFPSDWHAGDHLSITWQPKPGPLVTDGTASTVVLQAKLIGPYRDVDALLQAVRQHKNDPVISHMGPIVASSSPITTTNWTKRTFSSLIVFPTQTKHGYYDLLITATITPATSFSTRADGVLRVP